MSSSGLRCLCEKEASNIGGTFECVFKGTFISEIDLGPYPVPSEIRERMVEVPREELERIQKLVDIECKAEDEARIKRLSG